MFRCCKKKDKDLAAVSFQPEHEAFDTEEIAGEIEVENEIGFDSNKISGKDATVNLTDQGASCLSRIFFFWFNRLLILGVRRELSEEDLGVIADVDEPKRIHQKFERLWNSQKPRKNGKRSLTPVFFHLISYRTIFFCAILASCRATVITVLPFVSKELIENFQEEEALTTTEKVVYVLMLSFLPLVAALCEGQLNFLGRRASAHLFEAFTMAIYNKSLRLSAGKDFVATILIWLKVCIVSRSQSSTGQTVTMMATDAGNSLQRVVFQMFPLIIAPIQIVVIVYLLYSLIGSSMIAGVVLLVVSLPINIAIFVAIGFAFRAIMIRTDDRVKLVNEIVAGIRVIKSYAWEKPFIGNLTAKRNEELKYIRRHAYWFSIGITTIFMQLPLLLQVGTIVAFYLLGGDLLPEIVFTALQLFNLLQLVMVQVPSAINQAVTAVVALRRIRDFLELEELEIADGDTIELSNANISDDMFVQIEDSSFTWGAESNALIISSDDYAEDEMKDSGLVLRNINLQLSRGERVGIFGAVGSGKSSLLMAIIGEVRKLSGRIRVQGNVAFAAQNPWILNATIKENILFGRPYDEELYRKVVSACALLPDLKQLSAGDSTMIGERGINMSGGQKARISLARAVYCQAKIVMLDDPLAAVDAHVGDHIFRNCIMSELLDDRLVLLVTNKVQLLPSMDRVLVLKDKTIVGNGTFDVLRREGINFSLDEQDIKNSKKVQDGNEQETTNAEEIFKKSESLSEGELYKEEDREIGQVSFNVYLYYVWAVGYKLAIVAVLFNIVYLLAPLALQYILSFWSNEVLAVTSNVTIDALPLSEFRGEAFWLSLYVSAFSMGVFFCIIAGILMAEARLVAVKKLHELLIDSVLAAPISFFDVTPVGRILNRFSKDMTLVDTQLSMIVMFAVVIVMYVGTSFAGIVIGTRGSFIVVLIPVLYIYYRIYSLSRKGAIRLQRIEAITRSPIYSRFSELLNGLSTVRAYNQAERFSKANEDALRKNILPYFFVRCALPPWLMVSLNMMGVLISSTVAIIIVLAEEFSLLTPGEAGLTLTFALTIMQSLYQVVFVLTEVEVLMNSVERLREYIKFLPREESLLETKDEPPEDWPQMGNIQFVNYTTGYRDGPDVLKDLNLEFDAREKIGIVGRTGSGKSTLILSLLRVVEPREGSILIDGVDISSLRLEKLRSSLGLIPQDPVCFIGTIRYNLDPFGVYDEDRLWDTIRKVQLFHFIDSQPEKLDYMVQEGGENLSVGQRQLICIGRALLRNTRVLLLDEATASLDKETDNLIQLTIRDNFAERTVVTIAHRIDTIMDSTRILVLEKGEIAEFDTPDQLLSNPDGIFTSMYNASRRNNNE